MKRIAIIILHIIAIAIAISAISFLAIHNNALADDGSPIEIGQNFTVKSYFCKNVNCSKIITEELKNSTKIRCAFYTLNSRIIMENLAFADAEAVFGNGDDAAVLRGLYEDSGYYDARRKIVARENSDRGLMHDKFCIFTREENKTHSNITITGSYNPKDYGALDNYDSLIITDAQGAYLQYSEEFEELHKKRFGTGKREKRITTEGPANNTITEYFCPDDDCSTAIVNNIGNATLGIDVMEYVLTDNNIADALVKAYERGVNVRVILDSQFAGKGYSEGGYLRDSGVSVRVYSSSGIMHHKTMILDGKNVIDGSMNPTGNGNGYNDENLMIIGNDSAIAAAYEEEFNSIWNSSK